MSFFAQAGVLAKPGSLFYQAGIFEGV
jgi:hypothetical protein